MLGQCVGVHFAFRPSRSPLLASQAVLFLCGLLTACLWGSGCTTRSTRNSWFARAGENAMSRWFAVAWSMSMATRAVREVPDRYSSRWMPSR